MKQLLTKNNFLADIQKKNISVGTACDCTYDVNIEKSKLHECKMVETGFQCPVCKIIYPYQIYHSFMGIDKNLP